MPADFICYGKVLLELKAMKQLSPIERAQVLHDLRAIGFKRTFLIDFGGQAWSGSLSGSC